jgi:hypothetical protein
MADPHHVQVEVHSEYSAKQRGNNMKNPPMKRSKSETHVHREDKGVGERKRQSMYVHVHPHVWLTVSD